MEQPDDDIVAEALYRIGNTGYTFSIQAKRRHHFNTTTAHHHHHHHWKKEGKQSKYILLQIDWSHVPKNNDNDAFFLVPPPPSSYSSHLMKTNDVVDLGWKCNDVILMT
eukprot:10465989-Ditylum_brightwellii.AAC.1